MPWDCSLPGSFVHGILQARILEWLPFPSPGALLDPGIEPGLLYCRQIFYRQSYRGSNFATRLGPQETQASRILINLWLPRWLSGKESACQCRIVRRHGFDPSVGKIRWRRKWQRTPVFLPGEYYGQRSLTGYSSRDRKESDTTEQACTWKFVLYSVSSLMYLDLT